MAIPPVLPQGESLRRAVAWLMNQETWTAPLIEEACRRFDVTPADEEFLLRELRHREAGVGSAG